MTSPYVRLRHLRIPTPPPAEPPACNLLTKAGEWCVLPEGHHRSHLPLPQNYPPARIDLKDAS